MRHSQHDHDQSNEPLPETTCGHADDDNFGGRLHEHHGSEFLPGGWNGGVARRSLLRAAGAAGVVSALGVAVDDPTAAAKGTRFDLVLRNGTVWTGGGRRPVRTIGIKDGRIELLTNSAATAPGSAARVIDLEGRMVVPGFVDGHNHAYLEAEELFWVGLRGLETVEEYQQAFDDYLAAHPDAAQVRGVGFNQRLVMQWSADRGITPAELLESLVPGLPVVIISNGHHELWVNTTALELAGITDQTPNPDGGVIERVPGTSTPNGILYEFSAHNLVIRVLPQSDFTVEEYRSAVLSFQERAALRGVTSVLVPVHYPTTSFLDALQSLDQRDELTVYYDLALWADETRGVEQVPEIVDLRQRYAGGRRFTIDSVKFFGTGASRNPGLVWDQDVLEETMAAVDEAGLRIYVHVIGSESDYAAILDGFEHTIAVNGRRSDARHTITHTSSRANGQADRYRAMDIIADGHPAPSAFVEADVRISSSSDYPVRDFWPLDRVESGVRAWTGDAKALDTYLRSHTINGAHLIFRDEQTGSLEKGKDADLVVLDQDLFSLDPEQISETGVLMTVIQGRVVHSAPSWNPKETQGPRRASSGAGPCDLEGSTD